MTANLRLGRDIPHLIQAGTCSCGKDLSTCNVEGHALRFSTKYAPSIPHNAIRDHVAMVCREAGMQTTIEDKTLFGGKPIPDVVSLHTDSGKTWVMDVVIADPHDNNANCPETKPGAALNEAVRRKRVTYKDAVTKGGKRMEKTTTVIPLATEIYDGWSSNFSDCVRDIAATTSRRLGKQSGQTTDIKSLICRSIAQRIGVTQQRSQAVMIRHRLRAAVEAKGETMYQDAGRTFDWMGSQPPAPVISFPSFFRHRTLSPFPSLQHHKNGVAELVAAAGLLLILSLSPLSRSLPSLILPLPTSQHYQHGGSGLLAAAGGLCSPLLNAPPVVPHSPFSLSHPCPHPCSISTTSMGPLGYWLLLVAASHLSSLPLSRRASFPFLTPIPAASALPAWGHWATGCCWWPPRTSHHCPCPVVPHSPSSLPSPQHQHYQHGATGLLAAAGGRLAPLITAPVPSCLIPLPHFHPRSISTTSMGPLGYWLLLEGFARLSSMPLLPCLVPLSLSHLSPNPCSSSTTSTSSMDPLGYWLLLVAFARLSSVYFGYFNLWALQVAVYSKRTMSDVHGRTFAVWTAVTCMLCILCALHLDSRPLYLATLASFLFALLHFLLELLVYKTMTLKNFAAPCFFA
ncbi:unnamed protein product, partial [Closterium sp. NIES-54]